MNTVETLKRLIQGNMEDITVHMEDEVEYSLEPHPDLIAALSDAITHMEWIPCSERLPEDVDETYLVRTESRWGKPITRFAYINTNNQLAWGDDYSPEDVTHWMPLPSPPEKRDEE